MDFLIEVILDFFCVYNRDAKKTGKGWLYKFLLFMNVVAAGLVGQAEGVAATVFAVFFGGVAVVLFIKIIRHEDRCIDEWSSGESCGN